MVKMKILIIGASGFVGEKLFNILSKDFEVIGTYSSKKKDDFEQLDMSNRESVVELIGKIKPDVVVHTAGITNVDFFEENHEEIQRVNVQGTKNIIEGCLKTNSKLIYISTDYVFDGEKGNYKEEDEPNSISVYGKVKLEEEELVKNSHLKYLILRISVPYGYNSPNDKQTFEKWVINNLKNNKEISVIDDQFNTPTLIDDIANAVKRLIELNKIGAYHVTGSERISRYDFAIKIANIFRLNKALIKKIETKDLKWKAKRPKDSSLNIDKLKKLDVKMSNINEGLDKMKRQMGVL
jgi:dTDP-4-dehydrorhamnose reductase